MGALLKSIQREKIIHVFTGSRWLWFPAVFIPACFGVVAFLFVFSNFLSIPRFIPWFFFITILGALLTKVLLALVIQPRLNAHPPLVRWILLVFSLTGAILLVICAPAGVGVEMVNKLEFSNPYIQRAMLQETDLSISATGRQNPIAADNQVVLYYMTSQNGDISYQAFGIEGDWTQGERSLTASGDLPATLTWRGRPGNHVRLVFRSAPEAGVVELAWQDQTQTVDLYSADENEVIVDLDYQVLLYGYARVLIALCFIIVAGTLLFVLFLLLQHLPAVDFRRQVVVSFFFLAYLMIGMFAYPTYGLSWDEPAQRRHGMVSARYVTQRLNPEFTLDAFESVPDLPTYRSRNYGVAFTLPLSLSDALINFSDTRDLWLFRHYATFLFFFLGVAAFYKLLIVKFFVWWQALLGTIFFVLSPRIFAESFYNVKDTAFLAAFTIALLFAFRYWRRPTLANGFLFGITAAYATNIRIITILLVGLGVLFAVIQARSIRAVWRSGLVMAITYCAFVFVFWPATWHDPIGLVTETFTVFSDYTRFDYVIMFRGEPIRGYNVPFEYIPVWVAITTPLLYVTFFSVGAMVAVGSGVRTILRRFRELVHEDLVFLAITVLPVLAAIIMQSTLYTAWRHFFFIYSSFIVLMMSGLVIVLNKAIPLLTDPIRSTVRMMLALWIGGSVLLTGRWMVLHHPFQNTYFGDPMVTWFGGRQDFERDYWGLSLRQGLERILAEDDRQRISYSTDGGTTLHAEILTAVQRERLELKSGTDQNPDYVLRIYRNPFKEYPYDFEFEIAVDGLPILTVYSIPK